MNQPAVQHTGTIEVETPAEMPLAKKVRRAMCCPGGCEKDFGSGKCEAAPMTRRTLEVFDVIRNHSPELRMAIDKALGAR